MDPFTGLLIGLAVLAFGFGGGYLYGYWAGRRAEFAKWDPALDSLMSGDYQSAKARVNRTLDAPQPSRWEAFTGPKPW